MRQLAKESLTVIVAAENLLPAVAAAGDVIQGLGKIDAWWASHASTIRAIVTGCNPDSTMYRPDPDAPFIQLQAADVPRHHQLQELAGLLVGRLLVDVNRIFLRGADIADGADDQQIPQ